MAGSVTIPPAFPPTISPIINEGTPNHSSLFSSKVIVLPRMLSPVFKSHKSIPISLGLEQPTRLVERAIPPPD
ncbi:MAG: hypothetical protein LBS95_00470 [Mycoplasmataceae bacterium]|jgi:hypothetical protein|nr:hypothetical protein [Mycoplasmataceae bacterium]